MSIETTIECINNNGTIIVDAFGGQPNYLFELVSDNSIIQTNSDGIFNQLESGNYEIIVYDALGCDVQESLTINSAPQADFSLEEYEFSLSNEPILLLIYLMMRNISWYWDFGDGNNSNEQIRIYTEPGIYFATLTVNDMFNCEVKLRKR